MGCLPSLSPARAMVSNFLEVLSAVYAGIFKCFEVLHMFSFFRVSGGDAYCASCQPQFPFKPWLSVSDMASGVERFELLSSSSMNARSPQKSFTLSSTWGVRA